jgi:serine phosphatase RsbU (regulator of sigma subunit)
MKTIHGQNMDSLKIELNKLPNDKQRFDKLNALIDNEYNDTIWPKYNNYAAQIARKYVTENTLPKSKNDFFFLAALSTCISNEGYLFDQKSNYELAIVKYKIGLRLAYLSKDSLQIGTCLNNIGLIESTRGNLNESIICFRKALKIGEQIADKHSLSVTLNNLATIFEKQGNYPQSIFYYKQSLVLKKSVKNLNGIANTYGNLGIIYGNSGNAKIGKNYLDSAYQIRKQLKDTLGVAFSLTQLGRLKYKLSEKTEGITMINKALVIFDLYNSYDGTSKAHYQLAVIYTAEKQWELARINAQKCFDISSKYKITFNKKESAQILYEVFKETGKPALALKYFEITTRLSDSLVNIETQRETINAQISYEYDKRKIAADAKILIKDKTNEARFKAERLQRFVLIGSIIVLLGISYLIWRGLVKNKKVSKLISYQKSELQLKQNEILDSITYAKRIQQNLIINEQELKQFFPDSFIYFQPKDIVSGDFYWCRKLSNGTIALLVGDSTGHGVPGAIMSMLNISCLEKSIDVSKYLFPAEILNQTKANVVETLNRKESIENANDGMDCSLIVYDPDHNQLKIASAFNSVLIVRNDQLIEVEADRIPVGKHSHDKNFTEHTFDLQKNDMVYLLTDGYSDQFGGEKNKKFNAKNTKSLLIEHSKKETATQKSELRSCFLNWKKETFQVDDVTIIGIRF